MLQGSLFRVPFWAQGLVPEDSFYTRMGRFWSQISKDEELAEMYAENQGAPSTRTVQCLYSSTLHDQRRIDLAVLYRH